MTDQFIYRAGTCWYKDGRIERFKEVHQKGEGIMKIIEINGNTITAEFTEEEVQVLLQYAVNQIIKERVEKEN